MDNYSKKFGKGERTVPHHSEKASKYYPAIDEAVPRKVRKQEAHKPALARNGRSKRWMKAQIQRLWKR